MLGYSVVNEGLGVLITITELKGFLLYGNILYLELGSIGAVVRAI